MWHGDFPGGPVVRNPPSNAGDAGSIPGQGTKILPQLSPHAATTEPTRSGAHAPQLERENCMPQLERSPHTTTKSPCTATKRSRMPQ